MQITRIIDQDGQVHLASESGSNLYRIEGDLYDDYEVTDERIIPLRRLAPIVPNAIFGIGLNYAEHADEMGLDRPDHPVVFMKNPAAIQ
ncbi:MAG: 5-carboxymethyl-2-hydroxymuconate isomerase, partial [Puniceicoccaceae bacterium]|nr:5-carboxymethyl-2-hydroxymuconate isomerase [Puniceicoccaceae bacterium]